MDRYNGWIYSAVGLVGCEMTNPSNGKTCQCVGLEFPLDETGEELDVKYLTLEAAKVLIVDLKDAVEACLNRAGGFNDCDLKEEGDD